MHSTDPIGISLRILAWTSVLVMIASPFVWVILLAITDATSWASYLVTAIMAVIFIGAMLLAEIANDGLRQRKECTH